MAGSRRRQAGFLCGADRVRQARRNGKLIRHQRRKSDWPRLGPVADPMELAGFLLYEGLAGYLAPAQLFEVYGPQIMRVRRQYGKATGEVRAWLVNGAVITVRVER